MSIYEINIKWIEPYIGVWQGDCHRCGLSVQSQRGENSDRIRQILNSHVCDPSKKQVKA